MVVSAVFRRGVGDWGDIRVASPNADVGAQPTCMDSLSTKYSAEPHSVSAILESFLGYVLK